MLGGPIQETAVVAVGGRIYVIGGFSPTSAVSDVRVFDTAVCSWSDGPDLPRAVHHANAAVVADTIYVLGAMETFQFQVIGDVWAYNPTTDTAWRTLTSMPAGSERGSAVTAAVGNVIYLAGGLRQGAVTTVSAYDVTTDTWDTTVPALPQPRDHGCGGVVGGRLYVMGGRTGSPDNPTGEVWEYEPGGAWTQVSTLPTPRGGTACAILDDAIFVIGGEGNAADPSGVFPQVESFVPPTGAWNLHPDMPTPRHGTGAAASDGVIYVPGGADVQAFGAVDTHEVLRP